MHDGQGLERELCKCLCQVLIVHSMNECRIGDAIKLHSGGVMNLQTDWFIDIILCSWLSRILYHLSPLYEPNT
jgi:hypothetical protein